MPRVIQVIEAEERRGKGTEDSIFRLVRQYWTLNGDLLAEYDPCPNGIETKSPPVGLPGSPNKKNEPPSS